MSCQACVPAQPVTTGRTELPWPSRPARHVARGLLPCRSFDQRAPPFQYSQTIPYNDEGSQRVPAQQQQQTCTGSGAYVSKPTTAPPFIRGPALTQLLDALGDRDTQSAGLVNEWVSPYNSAATVLGKICLPTPSIGTAVADRVAQMERCPGASPSSGGMDSMVGVEHSGRPGCDMHMDGPDLADAGAAALRFPAPAAGEPPAAAGLEATESTAAAAAVVGAAVVVWSPQGGGRGAASGEGALRLLRPWSGTGLERHWPWSYGRDSGVGPRRPGIEHSDDDENYENYDDDEGGDGRPAAGTGAVGTLRLPPALRGRPMAQRQDHHPLRLHQQQQQQRQRSTAVQRHSSLEAGRGSDSEAGRLGCAVAAARCCSSTPRLDRDAVVPSPSFVQQASQAIERLDVGGRLTLGSAATHGSAWPGTATTSPARARLVRQRSVGLTRKRVLV